MGYNKIGNNRNGLNDRMRETKDHDVLDMPDHLWNEQVNDQWIQEGINNRQIFYTASPETTENLAGVYGREISQIKSAGYQKTGDAYYPPSL